MPKNVKHFSAPFRRRRVSKKPVQEVSPNTGYVPANNSTPLGRFLTMSQKKRIQEQKTAIDNNSLVVNNASLKMPNIALPQKFINLLMVDGKKAVATQIFSCAGHQFLRALIKESPLSDKNSLGLQLHLAVKNVQPSLECRKCRVAGTSHQVPAIVSQKRGSTLAARWIIDSARKRKRNSALPFSQCLAQELIDAYEKRGRPRQRRDQYHKLSSGNRGYLRYRWW